MGVQRFVSRRGIPAMIWSDNCTNFIGAEKELIECIEKWNTLNIAAVLRISAISGGSIHPVRHIKVASERGWSVALREYFIPSPVCMAMHTGDGMKYSLKATDQPLPDATLIRFLTPLFVWLSMHKMHVC